MKLPCSSSSPPPVLTTTLPSRQYPYLPDPLHIFFNTINSSYFQCGVSNFLLGRYDRSSKDFEQALLYLRGNQSMYATRTIHSHLESAHSHTCPVIILNLGLLSHYFLPRFSLTRVSTVRLSFSFIYKTPLSGLSLIYLGQMQEGMAELGDATRQQVTEEHSVIDEAIRDRGEGYTVFSIVRVKRCLFPFQS